MTEALYERAEIFFAAKNLVDKDLFSKSDPFAVLFRCGGCVGAVEMAGDACECVEVMVLVAFVRFVLLGFVCGGAGRMTTASGWKLAGRR